MKISSVIGKNIKLRDVCEDDAEFILSLRLDKSLGQFISQTDCNLNMQIEWIKQYKQRINEYYFIIDSKDSIPCGTARIYDIRENSFSFGSWIIKRDAPAFVAIESFLLVHEIGFCKLGLKNAHLETKRENTKVVNFFKRFGAMQVNEDEGKNYFNLTYDQYKKSREKYRRFASEKLKY